MGYRRETLTTADGTSLAARYFEPTQDARVVALIAPAISTPQSFYAEFAEWLATQRCGAVTFDYRGIGESLQGRLRDVDADLMTWARADLSAALDAAFEHAAGLPVVYIGHSLGGQLLPFQARTSEVARFITVASGVGHWRVMPRRMRYLAALLWHAIVPAVVPICGYFPGHRLGIIGDMPAGAIWQWRRWCLHERYSIGIEGPAVEDEYADVSAPLLSLSFTDDELMSKRSIDTLNGFYGGADLVARRIDAAASPRGAIGHFGFFRAQMAQPLWEEHLLVELDAC